MGTTLKEDINEQVSRLPLEQQQQVLQFVRVLATLNVHGVSGKDLLRFAGTIDHEDLMTIE